MRSDRDGGYKPAGLQFVIHEANDRFGDSKPQSLASPSGAIDECVDADQIAVTIYQWTSAVARIDGRIGLDVNHGPVQFGLSAYCAHDSLGDGVVQSLRRSNGDDRLS